MHVSGGKGGFFACVCFEELFASFLFMLGQLPERTYAEEMLVGSCFKI
jgi:hypothetical protein